MDESRIVSENKIIEWINFLRTMKLKNKLFLVALHQSLTEEALQRINKVIENKLEEENIELREFVEMNGNLYFHCYNTNNKEPLFFDDFKNTLVNYKCVE